MKLAATAKDKKDFSKRERVLRVSVILMTFLVVAAFAYMIANPGKTQADIRNIERSSEISSIMEAIATYTHNTGNIPSVIPINRECASIGNEICRTGVTDCKNYVDLSEVTEGSDLKVLPTDTTRDWGNGTGYYVTNNGEGSVIICAPFAERNVNITIKQFMF
jgi:hypothetical protein